jgi:hypothetical protein
LRWVAGPRGIFFPFRKEPEQQIIPGRPAESLQHRGLRQRDILAVAALQQGGFRVRPIINPVEMMIVIDLGDVLFNEFIQHFQLSRALCSQFDRLVWVLPLWTRIYSYKSEASAGEHATNKGKK